ncbi:MAG TPA: ATP-binding cassette domain-containing protein [Chthoniobacteraceae bacterium]|jgi:lipoprotein-releasing system ATP-binding protein|nr:ATP-binding cassette domain-containing protein [Chthoniobacteraceae bacterium]
MATPSSPLLRADALCHRELQGISLAIEPGGFTMISGSGSGALLRILGLLDRTEAGEVWMEGRPTSALDDAARLELRNRAFGYVFAEPFVLDSFTVAENIAMPLFKISDYEIEPARIRTGQMLEFAGLTGSAEMGVSELPLHDHYRIALARALAVNPRILIAEQAGLNIPPSEFHNFAALLRSVPETLGIAVIATSPAGAGLFHPDREIRLEQGAIAADTRPVTVEEAPAHD